MNMDLPECSHDQEENIDQDTEKEQDKHMGEQVQSQNMSSPLTPKSFSLASTLTDIEKENTKIILSPMPLNIRSSYLNPITVQPRSNLQSPMSLIMPGLPASLFLLALNKLNECPPNLTGLDRLKMQQIENTTPYLDGEITPPGSLTSAPPSYSFVLRQMAARRRPRLMGTFIPSPSFIQHTPPPTYATAFDIYVDNRLTNPPQRVYNFGITSMPAICPECGYTGMTLVISRITLCTHVCACILCLFCCWICAPLPYIMRSCKDVYHYCRNCKSFLGMYCPTNPEANFS